MNSVFVNTQGLYQRRRAYNMSYRNDFTCNLGELLPVYWQDLMPNTSWSCRVHGLIRFMPLLSPIMDNIDFYIHFWQAPLRILYGESFTKMITGEFEPEDWEGVYFVPDEVYSILEETYELTASEVLYLVGDCSIFDLLGYDKTLFISKSEGKLNARKFCMYFRLLSNWYTNENIEPYGGFKEDIAIFDDIAEDVGDISSIICKIIHSFYGDYGTAGFAPHMWPKDYFTAALPTLQFGLPTYLPLGDSAPVTIPAQGDLQVTDVKVNANATYNFAVDNPGVYANAQAGTTQGNLATSQAKDGQTSIQPVWISADIPSITGTADLSEATAITINELRVANALQIFKEREMRFGRRAPEYYKGFYGVTPGDLRLQLPKFLGGGRLPVNISDIEQTSQTSSGNPLGKLAGKGTAIGGGFARAHTFTAEEALVLGVSWLMPKITYANQLSRHDTKLNDRFDYYNPSFAHIGEQEVFNYEVFAGSFGTPTGSKEFGYQPRYTEYRFHSNEMHGDFKSSLAYWTLGRIFRSQPALNKEFVYMQPRAMQRIFAAQFDSDDNMIRNVLCSLKFQVAMLQPLSRYGTPGLLA